MGDHDLYALLVDAAVEQRDLSALQKFTPLAEASAVRYGHKLYEAITHRAIGVMHGLLGETTLAEEQLKFALERFRELGTNWQIGRTLAELGELAQTQADLATARACFTSAIEAFESLGALPNALNTRAMLEALN